MRYQILNEVIAVLGYEHPQTIWLAEVVNTPWLTDATVKICAKVALTAYEYEKAGE